MYSYDIIFCGTYTKAVILRSENLFDPGPYLHRTKTDTHYVSFNICIILNKTTLEQRGDLVLFQHSLSGIFMPARILLPGVGPQMALGSQVQQEKKARWESC